MSDRLDAELRAELAALAQTTRLRSCPRVESPNRVRSVVEGVTTLSFVANDYLGLAMHPGVTAAAAEAALAWGTGPSASRLVSGDLPPHRELEPALARWLDRPAALAFPSGYQTNLGVLGALASRDDLVVSDALNHASLIDGCRLSRATVVRYAHADAADAARALATPGSFRRRVLVTESLFSMDGDTAPLRDLARAAEAANAVFIVDEAHAIGTLGPGGRGLAAAERVAPDILIGTLGKAFGSVGGFIAASTAVRDTLVNRARTFLFTTGLSPAAAAAAHAALGVIAGREGDDRRARLHARCAQLRTALGLPIDPPSPIVPVVLGADSIAVAAGNQLRAAGLFVQPIRPPTVPEGSARLRVTLSADHEPADVDRLVAALRALSKARPQ